ncbi:hypothetical protein AAVH_06804 [Aphelenchoides avenae]|nr:hypothetical protein AAVH_06804 [Aphelenchus avenae]
MRRGSFVRCPFASFDPRQPDIASKKKHSFSIEQKMEGAKRFHRGDKVTDISIAYKKPPEEYEELIVDFARYVENLRAKENYAYLYEADAKAVWLDVTSGKCMDNKGAVLTHQIVQ